MPAAPGSRPVVALSADLLSSRAASERRQLAARIEATLAAVNEAWRGHWVAPLESTRGLDEVSGVLATRRPAFDVVTTVNVALWPHRFRFAIADGTLDVVGERGRASDMDGPAFHRTADALARARRDGLPMALALAHGDATELRMAEALAALHHTLVAGWTPTIARAIQLHRPPGGPALTQAEVARELGNTQQAVSDAHRRGHLKTLVQAEDALRAWLAREDER